MSPAALSRGSGHQGSNLYINRLTFLLLFLAGFFFPQAEALNREDLFPFGEGAGDGTIFRNDDDFSLEICPSVPYSFYDRKISCFYASNNGIITFTEDLSEYSSDPFPLDSENGVIAPFYGDVDTRQAGDLFFRETSTDSALLARVDAAVRSAFVSAAGFSSRSVSVITWDRVGYFRAMSDKLNTFQCVLASDSNHLYVLFLYADIQWIRAGSNSPPAQVGFNAGDLVNFYTIPASQTNDVINLNMTSNIGVPGMWIFKASGADIISGGCQSATTPVDNPTVPVTIFPAHGNQLGGTLISIQGPCFSEVSNIQCDFGGDTMVALYESNMVAHCVTPPIPKRGRVLFRLLVDGVLQGETTYTAEAIERGHQVDLVQTPPSSVPLAFSDGSILSLTWSPQAVFPQVDANVDPFNVDIHLYTLDTSLDVWNYHSSIVSNTQNDGSEIMPFPSSLSDDITPFIIYVATSLDPSTRFNSADLLYMKIFRSNQRVGIWTSIYYYINPRLDGLDGRSLCLQWYDQEPDISPLGSLGEEFSPCAPTREQAELPTSGLIEVDMSSPSGDTRYGMKWINTFHPRTQRCFRQSMVDMRSPDPPSEQVCCYDYRGYLVTGYPGGGAVSTVSPDFSRAQHFLKDVRPYFLCCTGQVPNCGNYYEKRPSDTGNGFNPPRPAWMIGDPHIITLDNLRYTFNGHGELILLQISGSTPSSSPSFTLQGRSLPFPGSPGATVFTAIAARLGGVSGQRITVSTSRRGLDAYIGNERLDLNATRNQYFDEFTVTRKDNGSISITFLNGVYLECRVEATRGLMSTIIVGIPETFMNQTKGLLGVHNGIKEDDLTPNGSNTPLSIDATLVEIHQDFGLSWLVTSASESLFTQLPYQNFSQITNITYEPVFTLTPNTSLIQLCNNDSFCMYDVMVTGDNSFGLATLTTVMEASRVEALIQPVSCDPSCSNGACLPGNICSCPEGYTGGLCQTILTEDCGSVDPNCLENEVCLKQAGSYICILDCTGNPSSSLCNPTTAGSTSTITIIIAAISVAGGLALILACIMCLAFMVVCCRRKSGKENIGGHKNNNNRVVADSTSSTLDRKLNNNSSLPRVSTTLPPSYSELEKIGREQVDHVTSVGYHNALPSPDVRSENGYMNVPHGVNANNNNNPPPHARRSSLGGVTITTPITQLGVQIFPLRGPPPARAQSHNAISVSHVSEDSGINIELTRQQQQGHVTTSNVQLSPRNLSPIQEPWYQNSTLSMHYQDHNDRLHPGSPSYQNSHHHHPTLSPSGHSSSQTLPHHSQESARQLLQAGGPSSSQTLSHHSQESARQLLQAGGPSFHKALQMSASTPGSRCGDCGGSASGDVRSVSGGSSGSGSGNGGGTGMGHLRSSRSYNSVIDDQPITEV